MWIKEKGKRASKSEAPIIVSNHLSFIEPVVLLYKYSLMAVAKSESKYNFKKVKQLPIIGTFAKSWYINL
jgi:1-acyl-sn-glycerol-3-phosphate acyltransferase